MTLILSGTDGLSDVDGSAATPAIRGTDANTGIFFPSADVIAFSEGGVEAMRIDANGDLLAGTTDTSFFSGSNRGVGLYGSNGFIAASRSNAISGLFNRFNSDGEVIQLRRSGTSVGTLDVSTTGVTMTGVNGITFTATQTASAGANTLDDYEEGTFSPTIAGWSGTYAQQVGQYTKIGNMIFLTGRVSTNGGTGTFSSFPTLASAPFALATLQTNYGQIAYAGGGFTPGAGVTSAGVCDRGDVTQFFLNVHQVNSGLGNLTSGMLTAASSLEIRFNLAYKTT